MNMNGIERTLNPDVDPGHRAWADPASWRGGWLGVYVAPEDPRLLVRKRQPHLGWTLNFAHRASWLLFVGGLLAFVLLLVIAIVADTPRP